MLCELVICFMTLHANAIPPHKRRKSTVCKSTGYSSKVPCMAHMRSIIYSRSATVPKHTATIKRNEFFLYLHTMHASLSEYACILLLCTLLLVRLLCSISFGRSIHSGFSHPGDTPLLSLRCCITIMIKRLDCELNLTCINFTFRCHLEATRCGLDFALVDSCFMYKTPTINEYYHTAKS